MTPLWRRLLRASFRPVERRFDYADVRLTASVDTVVRHVDARFGEASAMLSHAERGLRDRMEAIELALARVDRGSLATNEALIESTAYVGRLLRDLQARTERMEEVIRSGHGSPGPAITTIDELDDAAAALMNHAQSHLGFAAQAGLWFNPPVAIEHRKGSVTISHVTERIVEIPYVFRALASLEPGSRVLDVGGTESTVPLSLASLGYEVTTVDPRPYPLAHPSLAVVTGPLEAVAPASAFAAAIVLSSVEHFGLGAYGEPASPPGADVAAMRLLLTLVRPGGLLILTVPYGEPGCDDLQRTYDKAGVEELVEGWTVVDWTVAEQVERTAWVPVSNGSGDEATRRVAMVTAVAQGVSGGSSQAGPISR